MPQLFVIAGCNGAGKTTLCQALLPNYLGVKEFVNADEIARGLSPFNPGEAAFAAGRIMLQRIRELSKEGIDFAIETTLSSKTYQPLFKQLKTEYDYEIILMFVYLSSAEEAVKRVSVRVQEGGHGLPASVIRRRYKRGLKNLAEIYFDLADRWLVFDNTAIKPTFVAEKKAKKVVISQPAVFQQIFDHE